MVRPLALTPRAERVLVVMGIVAAGVGIDGLLMLWVGAGALVPATGTYAAVPSALAAVGVAASALCFLLLGRRARSILAATTPRLYPFAPFPVNAGLYVVILVGAVSVFHGFFDVFTSAHNGGDVSGLTDQGDLSALLIGASVVVWILTVYAVLLMFRVFRLGRYLDPPRAGRDVYGRPVEPSARPPGPARLRADFVGGDPGDRAVLFAVTLLLALVVSAAIQVLEIDVGPAPVAAWLWAQPFTPLLTLPVAAALGLLDHGLRDLERRFVERVRSGASSEPTVGSTLGNPSPALEFVQH